MQLLNPYIYSIFKNCFRILKPQILISLLYLLIVSLSTAHAGTIRVNTQGALWYYNDVAPFTQYFSSIDEAWNDGKSRWDYTNRDGSGSAINPRPFGNIVINDVSFQTRGDYETCGINGCNVYPTSTFGVYTVFRCPSEPIAFSIALSPEPQTPDNRKYICMADIEYTEPDNQCRANPILPSTGEKIQFEADFVDPQGTLSFQRTYRSSLRQFVSINDKRLRSFTRLPHSVLIDNGALAGSVNAVGTQTMGAWVDSNPPNRKYPIPVKYFQSEFALEYNLLTESGQVIPLGGPSSAYVAKPDVVDRLTVVSVAGGSEYQVVRADNSVEVYDARGLLVRKTAIGGNRTTYQYSTFTTAANNTIDLLTRQIDQFGRSLNFTYDAKGRLIKMVAPDAGSYVYAYDISNNLTSVTYPDGKAKLYSYSETANISGGVNCGSTMPSLLTSIVNEQGVRFADFKYDCKGRAVSSEHAGAVEKYTFAYPSSGYTDEVDPVGNNRRYSYSDIRAVNRWTSTTQDDGYGRRVQEFKNPDANGNPTYGLDFKGFATSYTFDTARNLEIRRSNSLQTIATQWHPTFRLPVLITESGRTMAYTYDAQGNKLTETITDTTLNQSRTWAYTYNPQGLVATLADPRSAAAGKSWQFTYDTLGNRTRIKNPLNQDTVYTHDAAGRTLTETAPNGLRSAYTYDLRGRLLTVTTSPSVAVTTATEVTTYTYTPSGQLASAALPNGYAVTYTYDPAQRLIAAADNRSNRIAYTLDAMGNRTREEVKDAGGQIALATTRSINQLNRVATVAGAVGQTTQLAYDANGELLSQTDPLNQTTAQTLDALRRPTATKFPDNTTASQTYNALDQLTQATDPKGVATVYQRNAFGEVLRETSSDIGTTVYTRDAVGDVATMTDAKGNVTNIVRDLLGRPTQVSRSATDQSFFTWDSGTTGSQIGYLAQLQDKSGTTVYVRDAFGRILSKTQTVNDNSASPSSYKTSYSYAKSDLASITYPSGLKVHYTRSPSGQITAISTQVPGTGKPITAFVSGLSYTVLGQPKAWSWAFNGDAAARVFDTDGRMTASELASYSFDAASRITAITQQLWASRTVTQTVGTGTATVTEYYKTPATWTAGYDSRNRLTGFVRGGSETRYTYDANSNRLTSIDKTISDTNLNGAFDLPDTSLTTSQSTTLATNSNRLLGFKQSITNVRGTQTLSTTAASVTYTIDANGNLTSDGLRTFEYDESNRLSKVRILKDGEAASIKYLYNAMGQQVFKSEPKPDQLAPNQTELGTGFINWLRTNFGWLYAQAQTDASLGSAYVYADGQLPSWAVLGEYDNGSANATGRTEYIWLPTEDGSAIPVGMFRNGKFFAIHPDHLGTPRLVTDNTNKVVWQWAYSGFGNNNPIGVLKPTTSATSAFTNSPVLLATQNPAATLDLRFPGQMVDVETGLFYNQFRSYWPIHGRYTQSDPIGLAGGLNRRGYVSGNALARTDPLGLWITAVYDHAKGKLYYYDDVTDTFGVGNFESGGKPWGDAIPNGKYDLLDHPDPDFLRLEPSDSPYGDDTDNRTGRDKFRLHRPGRTVGCIAATDPSEWIKIRNAIRNTKTTDQVFVKSKSRNPWTPKLETLRRFGTLIVTDSN